MFKIELVDERECAFTFDWWDLITFHCDCASLHSHEQCKCCFLAGSLTGCCQTPSFANPVDEK